MSYLVRKITKSRWIKHKPDLINEMPLTMIHNEFPSDDDSLSLWYAQDYEQVLDSIVILALNLKYASTIDVCLIPFDDLDKTKLILQKTDGETIINAYINRHYDLQKVTYNSIGEFSKVILKSIENSKVVRFTSTKLKNELARRMISNEFDIDLVGEDLRLSILEQSRKNTDSNTIVNKEDFIKVIQDQIRDTKVS